MAALAVEHHRLVDSAASSSLHLAQSSPNPSSALPPKEPLAASLDASVANGNNQLNGMSRSSGGSSGADLDPALALELSRHPHHHLGTWLYHPPPPVLPADSQMFATTSPATCFLPPLDALVNSTLQVVVPARDLTAANPAVHLAALWGTDIYTDDSDIVAMLVHSGHISLPDSPYTLLAAKLATARQSSLTVRPQPPTVPADHDLVVTLRVYPRLQSYPSTHAHGLASRAWLGGVVPRHTGVSLRVESAVPRRGMAAIVGRRRKQGMVDHLRMHMVAVRPQREGAEPRPDVIVIVGDPDGGLAWTWSEARFAEVAGRKFGVADTTGQRFIFVPDQSAAPGDDAMYSVLRVPRVPRMPDVDLAGSKNLARAQARLHPPVKILDQVYWTTDVAYMPHGITVHGLGLIHGVGLDGTAGSSGAAADSNMDVDGLRLERQTMVIEARYGWYLD